MKKYSQINEGVYNELASEYKTKAKDFFESDKKLIAPFVSYIKKIFKNGPMNVLEPGPGSGLNLFQLEGAGLKTMSIDISENILDVARSYSPHTYFIQGDFLKFKFGGLRFEGVFSKAFIHMFPKKEALTVIQKIYALLVPQGMFFTSTTIHEQSEEGLFAKSDYKNPLKRFRKKWTEKELIVAIEDAGFCIFKKTYTEEPEKNKKRINIFAIKPGK